MSNQTPVAQTPPTTTQTPTAPSGGGGASSGGAAVQLKAALQGKTFEQQSATLRPLAPVQKKASGAAVQRAPNSTQDVSSSEQQIVDDRAKQRGTTLRDQELKVRGQSQGNGKLNNNEGVSMAENPAFEADATAFEKALGVSAYTKGQGPADAMATKARTYLLTKVGGTEWTTRTAKLEAELVKIGSDNAKWSGSVGKAFQDLLDALNTGNVAVKMCHLENFYTNILVPDLKADTAPIDALLQGVDNVKKAQAEQKLNALKTGGPGAPFAVPSGSEVEGQGKTRGEAKSDGSGPSQQTVGSVGVKLDPAELKLQQSNGQQGQQANAVKLQWEEGAEKWAMNEYNKWVFLHRQLSLPLMAGPSGTTNKIMNFGAAVAMDPYDTRLACMGYLLPARHHSLVEIMAAAAGFGCNDFVDGRQMYTSIKPFTASELRGFGGGKFPHEKFGDKQIVGQQVVDK